MWGTRRLPDSSRPSRTRPPLPAIRPRAWAGFPGGREHGGQEPMVDARPIHRVHVDGFWMDTTEVTNENGYGLFDMSGNVWEWGGGWGGQDTYAVLAAPRGGAEE